MSILVKPIITEKSIRLAKKGFYTFGADKAMDKLAIKKAVEEQFGVEVLAVKTVKMPGKTKRFFRTGRLVEESPWKKAVVEVKKGQKIPIFEVSE